MFCYVFVIIMFRFLRYMNFKMTYYTAIAYFYMGVQAEEEQQMGLRVAYFQGLKKMF